MHIVWRVKVIIGQGRFEESTGIRTAFPRKVWPQRSICWARRPKGYQYVYSSLHIQCSVPKKGHPGSRAFHFLLPFHAAPKKKKNTGLVSTKTCCLFIENKLCAAIQKINVEIVQAHDSWPLEESTIQMNYERVHLLITKGSSPQGIIASPHSTKRGRSVPLWSIRTQVLTPLPDRCREVPCAQQYALDCPYAGLDPFDLVLRFRL